MKLLGKKRIKNKYKLKNDGIFEDIHKNRLTTIAICSEQYISTTPIRNEMKK